MATDAEVQPVATDGAGDHQKLKKLGKYLIQRRLGAGGMGTVFLALDNDLQRTVALKVLPRERAANPKLVQRFKSEGQSAARLEDDNIVKIYESGEIDGLLYIALEYVDGTDVQDLVQKRKYLPVKRSIDIVKQVTLALQHAHEKGIVHRDIKPSNLMIRKDGLVKLADLGLARVIDDTTDTNITQPGMTVGTVDYMSPEQGRDSKLADIRSDIYSLGCTWYHMLTGGPPFPDGSVTSKMGAHANQSPPNPRTVNDNVPEAVVAVIHRMMAKEPRDRYQTPQELLVDLKQDMLGRQSVRSDVLAGLADSESNWEQPVLPDQDQQTASGRSAKTAASKSAKGKTAKDGNATDGSTADRTSRGKAAEPDDRVPQKMKTKRRKGGDNGETSARKKPPKAQTRATETKSRELPPRSKSPEKLGVSQKALDLDRVRLLVLVLIGACVVGGVGWAVVRMNSSMNDLGEGGTLNPYSPGTTDPATPAVVENGGPGTTGGEPPVETRPTEGEADNTQATQLNEYQNVELFSGAARREDVPDWLVEARAGLADDLISVVVSTEDARADHSTIAAALDRLPAAGGIIELAGRGPFPLPPLTIDSLARVVVRARPGSRPVVVLDATGSPLQDNWLTFRGETLALRGVHLVASGRHLAANAPAIQIDSGTLLMQESSLTIVAPATGPITGVQLGDGASTGANCLLENTFIRGAQLTSVRIASTAVNVLSGNSLFVSGAAPAIVIAANDVPVRANAEAKEQVSVSMFATAICSGGSVFGVATEDFERTPAVALRGHHCVFAASSSEAVWMRVANWPENESTSLVGGRAEGLTWVGEDCALLGWSNLIEFQTPDGSEPLVFKGEDGWRRFWNAATESRSFVAGSFGPHSATADRVTVDALASRIETFLVEADADRAAFDLDSNGLPSPPETLIDRIRAESARPMPPSRFVVAGNGTVTFDLSRGAGLNEFLNSSECPNGAVVTLTGAGTQMRPIVLRNKSVRLVFPAGEEAVKVRPVRTSVGERPPAFIRVEGGSIDLVNAQLSIPSAARTAYPLRILQVIDGSFTLHGCILRGQYRDGAQDVPVIEWIRGSDDGRHSASIRNSLVAGSFQTLSADLSKRLLQCENSVFTSVGDVFDLSGGVGPQPGNAVFTDCTFSAGGSAFLVRSNTESDARPTPINLFVERCVFAPPPETTNSGSVALTHPASAPDDGSIVWWGSDNGFAPQFRRFHQPLELPPTNNQDIDKDWTRLWGVDHVWRPLKGPTAVLLVDRLPEPDRVDPADYSLAETSEANTWGPGGKPIGARVGEIGPLGQTGPEDTQTPPGGRPRPTRSDPGF